MPNVFSVVSMVLKFLEPCWQGVPSVSAEMLSTLEYFCKSGSIVNKINKQQSKDLQFRKTILGIVNF